MMMFRMMFKLGLIATIAKVTFCQTDVLVDLSHWNSVNVQSVKLDGIVGIIHKATQGIGFVDPDYARRTEEARKQGLLWGAYHFGTGYNSGVTQAKHFLRTVGSTANTLLALDLEKNPSGETMTVSQAEEFVLTVKNETGRYPVVYGSPYFLDTYSTPVLTACPLWIAHWTSASEPKLPKGWSSWVIWQYTNGQVGGSPRQVAGIGPCDRDRYNGPLERLVCEWPNLQAPAAATKNPASNPEIKIATQKVAPSNSPSPREPQKPSSNGYAVHYNAHQQLPLLVILLCKYLF